MSHFTVLVVTEDMGEEAVSQALEPFYEQPDIGDPRLEFYLEIPEEELEEAYQDWLRNNTSKEEDTSYLNSKEWAEEYHGYHFEKGQGWGYYHNPNAKWDWWQIGGRWTGFFIPKKGASGCTGRPGLMTPTADHGTVDQIRKCDVDWKSMRASSLKRATVNWAEFLRQGALLSDTNLNWLRYKYGIADNDTEETYIERCVKNTGSTFAVLKDGQWYERGEMGWWGCVSNEKAKCDWGSEFEALLAEIPDNAVISVVDCHV